MQDSPAHPVAVRREDYRPPAFLVDSVALHFTLDPADTLVRSRLDLRRNPAHGDPAAPLRLDGEALTTEPRDSNLLANAECPAAAGQASQAGADKRGRVQHCLDHRLRTTVRFAVEWNVTYDETLAGRLGRG